ncbi:MAG: hypothetical protein GWP91_25755, partial [Rhodobacterales bacterium]|nr:hypothetical protein [Rhodobacterales bacterium]
MTENQRVGTMDEVASEIKSKGPSQRTLGCGLLVVLMIGLPAAGLGLWWKQSSDAVVAAFEAQEALAAEEFKPVYDKLDEAIAAPAYDLDKTVRVLHEVDMALAEKDSLHDYLMALSTQDYRDVAPEVLEARKEVLDVLMRLYAKQVEAEDQAAMWEVTSELLLSTLSVVSVSADANLVSPSGAMSVDREQAQGLLNDLKERQATRHQLVIDINQMEHELLEALYNTSQVYHRYHEEWEQLAILRDRSYLAAHNGDWAAAQASAELAIEKAPMEREAHLIAALARIELGNIEDAPAVLDMLSGYVEEHPDRSAPAFLLMGVLHQRSGDSKEALLAFQQSAAYYPKQAEQLTDMLDPYRSRSFLNQSREGGFIVELYKSTMLGAGYFSPDLQMARMMFEQGDDEGAKAKVLDHFAR